MAVSLVFRDQSLARCAAPMPPNAEMLVSKSGIVYFHDLENDYYTVEHPLTQRYLKASWGGDGEVLS